MTETPFLFAFWFVLVIGWFPIALDIDFALRSNFRDWQIIEGCTKFGCLIWILMFLPGGISHAQ